MSSMKELKLSELSEKNLVQFYIQATSFWKVKTFIVNDAQCIIKNVDEIETEMFARSQNYWATQIKKVQEYLQKDPVK